MLIIPINVGKTNGVGFAMQSGNYRLITKGSKPGMYPSASPPSSVFPMMGYAEWHSRGCGLQKGGRLSTLQHDCSMYKF